MNTEVLNEKVLLVGAGPMAVDYHRVLEALGCEVTVVGRSAKSAARFAEQTGKQIASGGLENFLPNNGVLFDAAIVAVGVEQLAPASTELLAYGFKNILVEKPGGLNAQEIHDLARAAERNSATVVVAYNRRFYASVMKAREIIARDGGLTSFHFEFTEWSHVIEGLEKKPGLKKNWLLANSTHVIDLAFYLGGKPVSIHCQATGELSWHARAVFAGAGKSANDVLFSYHANWAAPGRWGVELLTPQSRLILRPLEELQIQTKGSVAVSPVPLDNANDTQFKPGLLEQTRQFLSGNIAEFQTIQGQAAMQEIYSRIACGD